MFEMVLHILVGRLGRELKETIVSQALVPDGQPVLIVMLSHIMHKLLGLQLHRTNFCRDLCHIDAFFDGWSYEAL